ncbi:MAG: hypothetical protein FIA96_10550 [Betaproteobacteria bacterium]|nr:hypothetical protein [Betaproteobacteria bacterium]
MFQVNTNLFDQCRLFIAALIERGHQAAHARVNEAPRPSPAIAEVHPAARRLAAGMCNRLSGSAAMALLAGWLALPSPVLAEPPPWAPAHGYRAKLHRYVYYPQHEVYYAPTSQLWFWLDGGNWRAGAILPGRIAVAGSQGVAVVLGTERPYEMNTYVVERYGKRHSHRRHWHHDHDG